MPAKKIVEIAADPSGRAPANLIEIAYRASRDEPITLILNGISRSSVDRILDPVVEAIPLSIPGVVYVDLQNIAAVRNVVLAATAIFIATREFHSLIRELGAAPTQIRSVRSKWSGVKLLDARTTISLHAASISLWIRPPKQIESALATSPPDTGNPRGTVAA
jgi:hypothetical protein